VKFIEFKEFLTPRAQLLVIVGQKIFGGDSTHRILIAFLWNTVFQHHFVFSITKNVKQLSSVKLHQ
jgi:hypothetical protein